MQDLVELERRISAALERLARGVELVGRELAPGVAGPLGEEADPASAATLAESAALADVPAPLLLSDPLAAESPEDATAPEAAAGAAQDQQEHSTFALLREKLAAAREREVVLRSEYESRIEKLTRQLDVQGTELQRMRKTAIALREELKRLRESEMGGQGDPALINRAMLAELDALRATRLTEIAELDELTDALDDHLTEAEHA